MLNTTNDVVKKIKETGAVSLNEISKDDNNRHKVLSELLKYGKYKIDEKPLNHDQIVIRENPDYILRQSIIETNNAVKENYKGQDATNKISIGISIISLIFIGITTFQGCDESTEKSLQSLTKELRDIRLIYQQQQKHLSDTVLPKKHAPSLTTLQKSSPSE